MFPVFPLLLGRLRIAARLLCRAANALRFLKAVQPQRKFEGAVICRSTFSSRNNQVSESCHGSVRCGLRLRNFVIRETRLALLMFFVSAIRVGCTL